MPAHDLDPVIARLNTIRARARLSGLLILGAPGAVTDPQAVTGTSARFVTAGNALLPALGVTERVQVQRLDVAPLPGSPARLILSAALAQPGETVTLSVQDYAPGDQVDTGAALVPAATSIPLRYPVAGTYAVELVRAGSVLDTQTLTVRALTPQLTLSVGSIRPGGQVLATTADTDPGTMIDWGDDSASVAGDHVLHTYAAEGSYVVALTLGGQRVPGAPTRVVVVSAGGSVLTYSRQVSDYQLSSVVVRITEQALVAGMFGAPDADGYYVIPNLRVRSAVPGEPCVNLGYMSVNRRVWIKGAVLQGWAAANSYKTGLIFGENGNSVKVTGTLGFSGRPPAGVDGTRAARLVAMTQPRELTVESTETYGVAGIAIDGWWRSGGYRGLHVRGVAAYNLSGSVYNANGSLRLKPNGRPDGDSIQYMQINNAPGIPNVVVEYGVMHNDPLAGIQGQIEDATNVHSSSGTPGSPITFRQLLIENCLPWDPNWTGTQPVYGVDPRSASGQGLPYSGGGGLTDGYTVNDFTGTPTADDLPHHVLYEDYTVLNSFNYGWGLTAGNRCTGRRVRAITVGVIRSGAPGGTSRLAIRTQTESGDANNATVAMEGYRAQGDSALFFGHVVEDCEAAFFSVDASGAVSNHLAYINPVGAFTFTQGGQALPYNAGGLKVPAKPAGVPQALALLDAYRQERVDAFIAAGQVVGLGDRSPGDVRNLWNA